MAELVVYRVQNEKGQGPYASTAGIGHKAHAMSGHYDHPSPRTDWAIFSDDETWRDFQAAEDLIKEYLFAFPTRRAAFRWFGKKGLEFLKDYGFELVPVRALVVSVSDSGKQCMFKPKK